MIRPSANVRLTGAGITALGLAALAWLGPPLVPAAAHGWLGIGLLLGAASCLAFISCQARQLRPDDADVGTRAGAEDLVVEVIGGPFDGQQVTLPRQARAPELITLRAQASAGCGQPHLYICEASVGESLRYVYRPPGDRPRP